MKKTKYHDPWAEYGPPTTTLRAVMATIEGEKKSAQPRQRPTIDELERILKSECDVAIEIAPDGSIVTREWTDAERAERKPITMRENLGGEYAFAG